MCERKFKEECRWHKPDAKGKMSKTIITVVGKDTVGIIAKVCTYLADKKFIEISYELQLLGEEIGVIIKCQKEEIFDKMHRI